MSTEAKTIFDQKTKAVATLDSFTNFAARIGVQYPGARGGEEGNADNLLSKGHYDFNLVTRNRIQLEAAYRGAWIVGRVIDCVAEDMTKDGILPTTNEGAEQITDFQVAMSRLGIWGSLCDNIKWGRLYGGSIAILQINGQDLATPFDPSTVTKGQFEGLAVYDRWQLNPVLGEIIDKGPEIGLPKFYDIVLGNDLNDPGKAPGGVKVQEAAPRETNGRVRVHHSRCIRAIGIKLPFFQAITEQMWGESVLERMWDRLIAFDTATMSAGSLITRANLRSVSIEGLRDIVAAGGAALEGLIAQFDLMNKMQSSENITLLDLADKIETTSYSFAGLSDVMVQFGQQVSGSAEIPMVRLFGQTPTGLNTNGEGDLKTYHGTINTKQESTMRPGVEKIAKTLWASLFGKPLPKDFLFKFTPLSQMSALDKATIGKTNTDSVIEAHQEGLVSTATAMKELKQASADTGLFTHITDEEIEEADSEEPPMPEAEPDDVNKVDETPLDKIKKPTGDSAWKKIKAWLS